MTVAGRLALCAVAAAALGAALFGALRGCGPGDLPDAAAPRPSPPAAAPAPRARTRDDPPAAPPPRSVRVTVTSMDGRPIAGARVALVRGPERERPDDDFRPSVEAPRAEFTADAGDDGAALLDDVPSGRWFVVAEAPGFGRHVLNGTTRGEDDTAVDTSVALERASPFVGTIVDPDGAPAGGVTVVLEPFTTWPSDAACLRTTTAANGAYRFDAVEPGRYRLWYAVRPGFLVEAIQLLVPSLDGFDIRMVRGAAIEGVVRDAESGVRLPGARVFGVHVDLARSTAERDRVSLFDVGTADHLGRFAIRTWRPQFEVTLLVVDVPGYAPMPIDDAGRGPPGAVAERQRFVFDLRLRRAATFRGMLTSPDGPLVGFRVHVRPGDHHEYFVPHIGMWEDVTGADGRFVVDRLPVGAATIYIADRASEWRTMEGREADLAAGDLTVHDVHVDVTRVRVTRRIVDSDNEPVAGVDVVQRFGRLRADARTDAEGRFTLDAIATPDAPVFVEIRRGPFREAVMLSNVHSEDDIGIPTIPASPVATGKLVRADESPVAGERVDMVAGSEFVESFDVHWTGLGESFSGADGSYRMPLRSGPDFKVTVHRVGWLDQDRDENGATVIKVPDAVHLAGQVVAAEGGAPVAGALFSFMDFVVARAGADGRFDFTWTPPCEGPLVVAREGFVGHGLEQDADEPRVVLQRAGVVSGVVRGADGTPVSGLEVRVHEPGRTDEWRPASLRSATDADGRFVVPGLAAGPCVVTVTDPTHFAFANVSVVTTAGDESVALVVRPGARLAVEVVDGAGKELGGARVVAHPADAAFADVEATAQYDGRVEIGLATGTTYTLRVEHDDFEPAERPDVRGGGEALRIVLARKPPR